MSRARQALIPLGFTAAESEIYAFLLEESPATGYRIAQALGRPLSNVYKAVESLRQKGAVVMAHGQTRLCSAVPLRELLATLKRRQAESFAEAERALRSIRTRVQEEQIYSIASFDQVIERARKMLDRARAIVLMVAHPDVVPWVLEGLERAAARGVDVRLKTYAPVTAQGVELVYSTFDPAQVAAGPGDELNLVVDGCEHLLALVRTAAREVLQAIWSPSRYLAYVHHNALAIELILTAVVGQVLARADHAALEKTIARLPSPLETPGARELSSGRGHRRSKKKSKQT